MTSRLDSPAHRGRRRSFAVLGAAAALAVPAAIAGGAVTGQFSGAGGDSGQSGNQPVSEGSLPIGFEYRKVDAGEHRTGAVITAAASTASQKLVYGKHVVLAGGSNDRNDVFMRGLDDGEPATAIDVDTDSGEADPDGFGPAPGGVNPVSSSFGATPGATFVVHNDDDSDAKTVAGDPPFDSEASDNDIALAVFNESNNTKTHDYSVGAPLGGDILGEGTNPQPTDGYTIETSPVLSPPAADGSGSRSILFVAKGAADAARLFKVNVANAGSGASADPDTDSVSFKDIPGLNTKVPPVIAYLEDPARPAGTEIPYVIVAVNAGAGASDIRAFKVADFADGPAVGTDIPGNPAAISVPVAANGMLPGQPGSDTEKAPAIFVAYDDSNQTIVRRFEQNGPSLVLSTAKTSPTLSGKPAPGLAVAAKVVEDALQPSRVVVATSTNVHIVDSEGLTLLDRLQDDGEAELVSPFAFTKTAPTVSGNLIYVARDQGAQLVLSLTTGETVANDPTGFEENADNNTSSSSLGRPAVANGYAAFVSSNGVFAYRAALRPNIEIVTPEPGQTVSGSSVPVQATATDPDGNVVSVTFRVDDQNPFATDSSIDDDTYSATLNTLGFDDGLHTLTATAKDNDNRLGSDTHTFVINNHANPIANLKVVPSETQPTGTLITLDASGSTITPNEDETLENFRFDLDGNGTFEKDNGAEPKLATKFNTPGAHQVTVQVRDSFGDTATASATVVAANRPPIPAFSSPAIIKPGATGTFDATPSSDPDGSITLYEWDLDGNGDFETNTGTNPRASRQFPAAGTVRIQLRITDSNNATATVAKDLIVGNIPPSASFIAVPTAVNTNERVSFDATGSRDFDGGIAKYEWDLDGNGTFEVNGGNNPRTSRVYTATGVINVKLRVTDTDGSAAEAVRQIAVITAPIVRRTPRRLTISLSPKSDLVSPFRMRARGTLSRPSGISAAKGCSGVVTVATKAGNRTISSRRVRLNKRCRYSVRVSFRNARRFGKATALRVQATYGGNARLLRKRSAATSFRVKPATR